MATPTPSGNAPASIFSRSLPRGAAHAEGLTPEEEEQADKMGFGGSELDPPGLRLLKAYALQQDIRAVQVHSGLPFALKSQSRAPWRDLIAACTIWQAWESQVALCVLTRSTVCSLPSRDAIVTSTDRCFLTLNAHRNQHIHAHALTSLYLCLS